MAKINHNNAFQTINGVIENAKNHNAIHHYANDASFSGASLNINGKDCHHFATTGYLGLEQDDRIKNAAIEAIINYGTQFPLSKTYVSHPLYAQLEELLFKMYKQEGFVCKNSTLAHMGVIPQAVGDQDVVILDHQVHWSVHNACNVLKSKGIPIHMIRHNDMNQLEDYLKKYQSRVGKIWYMADGIYSMFGDHAPMKEITNLFQKYPQLNLYFDDVHGMSWSGIHGTGFIGTHWNTIPNRMILVTTLSKTFGASGAYVICGDKELHLQIKNFGGPLTFSAQLEPSAVAAAIASCKIHLSDEIYELQDQLQLRISQMQEALKRTDIPLIAHANTPVFYLGTALPHTAYWLVDKLLKNGFFVNPGIYPAVSMKNAGLRVTVSNHNSKEQMDGLVTILEHYYPIALKETNNSFEAIDKAFHRKIDHPIKNSLKKHAYSYRIHQQLSDVSEEIWNQHIGSTNALDYMGARWIEDTFVNRASDDHLKIEVQYYYILNEAQECVALFPMYKSKGKADLISSEKVSAQIESIRKEDPEYLVESVWSVGTLMTEGNHMFVKDNASDLWEYIIHILQENFDKSSLDKWIFRDFDASFPNEKLMINQGFVKVDMPQSAEIDLSFWNDQSQMQLHLSKRNRRHFKQDVSAYLNEYTIDHVSSVTDEETKTMYSQYLDVHEKNLSINTFAYDEEVFKAMNACNSWSFIRIFEAQSQKWVGTMFCYHNASNYSFNPMLVGLNVKEVDRLKVYRQLLYHTLMMGVALQAKHAYFGVSATFEKKKMGAQIIDKHGYIQSKDNYTQDVLSTFE